MTLFPLTVTRQYGYAFNVAQNHIEQAAAAPVRNCGLFMPVFNGGGARNSLRVITPRFLFSVLSPRRLSGLKSSLVGVLKRFEQGAFKMTSKSTLDDLTDREREVILLFRHMPKAKKDEILLKTFELAALEYAVKVLKYAIEELKNGK
mgnify:CR=1 FL=1